MKKRIIRVQIPRYVPVNVRPVNIHSRRVGRPGVQNVKKKIRTPHFKLPSKPILAPLKINYKNNHKILIILHLFYADTTKEFLDQLITLRKSLDFDIIVTTSEESSAYQGGNLSAYSDNLDAKILLVKNIGKDIIPKLTAVESTIKNNKEYDCVFMMHDKKSTKHTFTNNTVDRNEFWKKELIQVLFNDLQRNHALHLMSNDKSVGMIGSANHLHFGPGWSIGMPVRRYSKEVNLIQHQTNLKLSMNYTKIQPSWFIGGTMFWMRWSILKDFYNVHKFDKIYEFAKNDVGNVKDPSFTHYLERFFGQLVTMSNMKTIGI